MSSAVEPSGRTGKNIFPDRFLPAPVPVRQNPGGPTVPEVKDVQPTGRFPNLWKRIAIKTLIPATEFDPLLYDMYCLSVKFEIKKRVCKKCGMYYPSIAAVKRHRTTGCTEGEEIDEEDEAAELEMEEENPTFDEDDDCVPISNIFDIFKNSAFVDLDAADDDNADDDSY